MYSKSCAMAKKIDSCELSTGRFGGGSEWRYVRSPSHLEIRVLVLTKLQSIFTFC